MYNNKLTGQTQFPSPFAWSDFSEYKSSISLENAYKICQSISQKHYENFPVASFIIPKKIRKHFFSIYAFARYADDIADEKSNIDIDSRFSVLDNLKYLIENINDEHIEQYPILYALQNTVREVNLPAEPFLKLLTAFKMDVDFKQPETMKDLIVYCEHSANPIGELILRLFNEYTQETAYYSDKITTALQLINFWQDLSIDLKNNRCYIPSIIINEYVNEIERDIFADSENQEIDTFATPFRPESLAPRIGDLMDNLLKETQEMLLEGKRLVSLLNNKRLQFEIKLIVKSGESMLEKEKLLNYLLFFQRPKLKGIDYSMLLLKTVLWKY